MMTARTRLGGQMTSPSHVTSIAIGAATTVSGGLTLTDFQTIIGIVASLLGIVLTVATFVWRYRDHRYQQQKRREAEDEARNLDED